MMMKERKRKISSYLLPKRLIYFLNGKMPRLFVYAESGMYRTYSLWKRKLWVFFPLRRIIGCKDSISSQYYLIFSKSIKYWRWLLLLKNEKIFAENVKSGWNIARIFNNANAVILKISIQDRILGRCFDTQNGNFLQFARVFETKITILNQKKIQNTPIEKLLAMILY